jgi:hypothetical protein
VHYVLRIVLDLANRADVDDSPDQEKSEFRFEG